MTLNSTGDFGVSNNVAKALVPPFCLAAARYFQYSNAEISPSGVSKKHYRRNYITSCFVQDKQFLQPG